MFLKRLRLPEGLSYILLMFAGTRLALTVIGVSSFALLRSMHGKTMFSSLDWLNMWGVWDTEWYLDVARHGYSPALTRGIPNYIFYPAYPLLMRAVACIVRSEYIAGILISNLALIAACSYLYRLVRLACDPETARRSVKYLYLFPASFILSGVFSESLFLALLIMCFYYARKERWLLVGLLGFLLSLTRSIGVFLVVPLAWEYMRSVRWRNVRVDILWLGTLPLGWAAFAAYTYRLTGDLLAYHHVQQAVWGHRLSNPLAVILSGVSVQETTILLNAISTVAALAVVGVTARKIGGPYTLTAAIIILLPLAYGPVAFYSMLRYMLVAFPQYPGLALICVKRTYDDVVGAALLLLQGFLMVFWSNWFAVIV